MTTPIENQKSKIENDPTPWPLLYSLVLAAFLLCVILLTWFTLHFTRTA